MSREDIIERLKEVFKDKNYRYELVTEAKCMDDIYLICPTHGKFKKRLSRALNGRGCPYCSGKLRKTFEQFKEEATKVHNGKYIYNDTNYVNSHKHIMITCPKHGDFPCTPTNHLNGVGCPECNKEKLAELFSYNTEYFIKKARKVHGDKYDYSLVKYVNNKTNVDIICPKHGAFQQTPQAHYSGRGCSFCNESHLEREIRNLLDENGIEYIYQWHLTWSKYYSLDFYLPKQNIGIECQGIQHFEDKHFKAILKEVQERDEFKRKTCLDNGIKILYYSNIEGYNCITDKQELLKQIL